MENHKYIKNRLETWWNKLERSLSDLAIVGILIIVILASIIATHLLVPEDIRLIVDITLFGIGVFTTVQTISIRKLLHHYFTIDLLSEIALCQGIIVKRAIIKKDFKEIKPDSEYSMPFSIEGVQVIKSLEINKCDVYLEMTPARFEGSLERDTEEKSTWRVEDLTYCKESGKWKIEGKAYFDTLRSNLNKIGIDNVSLDLNICTNSSNRNEYFRLEMGSIPVFERSRSEVLQELINFGFLKKIPSSNPLIEVASDNSGKYYSNLLILSEKIYNAGKSTVVDSKVADSTAKESIDNEIIQKRSMELLASISRFINEEFIKLKNDLIINNIDERRIAIEAYKPKPLKNYDTFLNNNELLSKIMATMGIKNPAVPKTTIWVSLYQTIDFINFMKEKMGYGICVFGYPQTDETLDIRLVYNLEYLTDSNNPYKLELLHRKQIADFDESAFSKNFPIHSESQEGKTGNNPGQKGNIATEQINSIEKNEMYSNPDYLLEDMAKIAQCSLKNGVFLNSEQVFVSFWVDLTEFKNKIVENNKQLCLARTLELLINNISAIHGLNEKNLVILNLCSKKSGIGSELEEIKDLLVGTMYEKKCHIVGIQNGDLKDLPDDVMYRFRRMDIVVLAPLDVYEMTLRNILDYLYVNNNRVICILSLFSVAITWDLRKAPQICDIIPLYRLEPENNRNHPPKLLPLSKIAAFVDLRSWLFKQPDASNRKDEEKK